MPVRHPPVAASAVPPYAPGPFQAAALRGDALPSPVDAAEWRDAVGKWF